MIEVCREANPRLRLLRARFSALVESELQRSLCRLVAPNELEALAVDCRQEIDLRIGASFTRFQTQLLQARARCCRWAGAAVAAWHGRRGERRGDVGAASACCGRGGQHSGTPVASRSLNA